MAAMEAIWKIFRLHLPDRKSDWSETWWEASQQDRNLEFLKSFRSDIQDGQLETFLLPNSKSDWAQTWLGALCWHGDLKLLFVPVSTMVAMKTILNILKRYLLPNGESD